MSYWVFLVLAIPLGLGVPSLALMWLVGYLRASTDREAFYSKPLAGGRVTIAVWAAVVLAGFCVIEVGLVVVISSCVEYLSTEPR